MKTDILIVGAGPSGLMLANILAQHGVGFVVVDAETRPTRYSRANIVHVRTLELWNALGLAARALDRGRKITDVEVYERGKRAAAFPLAGGGTEGLTPFPHALAFPQRDTETLLLEGVNEHDGEVLWDTKLVDLRGRGDGVSATVGGARGAPESIEARWVVGADGAQSTVRRHLGLGFGGKTYEQTGLLADVRIDAPLPPATLRLHLTRGGFVGINELGEGQYRLFGAVPPGFTGADERGQVSHEPYATIGLEQVQEWFDDYFAVDAAISSADWTSLFRVHSRIADRFRVGNVFLVGDAAHIHSPAGGQGMNLGIGDAFNLGWKLALVATGQARERLLDSYEAERIPVARTILRNADRGFALEATSNRAVAWLRANVATRLVGPLVRMPGVRARVFRLFSQTWISYRQSPAVDGYPAGKHGPRPGDRAPFGVLQGADADEATSLFDLLRGTGHHLLIFEGLQPSPGSQADIEGITRLLGNYDVDVAVHCIPSFESELHRLFGVTRGHAFLIRPDGHIAYSCATEDLVGFEAFVSAFFNSRP